MSEPVKTSFGSIPWRSVLLLRVEDTEGAEGWGEIWCNFPPYSAENKLRLIETVIAPAALGMSCDTPAVLWPALVEKTRRWALQSGEHGPIAACLAGFDLAVWDLHSRLRGIPLKTALGADAEPATVPTYASGLNPDTAVDTIVRAREAGFTSFKVKVAFGLERDLATVDRINETLLPHESVMVDANQGWEVAEARDAVVRLSDRGVGWIEEPIPAGSPQAAWEELATLSARPIAAGENLSGFAAFEAMIQSGSQRIVQPDLLKWGGVTGTRAVAHRAVAAGLSYCPHWLGSPIGQLASAHVLAAVGGIGRLEHDVMDNPFREALITTPPKVDRGELSLPTGAGIGFTPAVEQARPWLLGRVLKVVSGAGVVAGVLVLTVGGLPG